MRFAFSFCYTAPVMNGICFDTSGPTGGVTVMADGRIRGSIVLKKVFGHNETLLPALSMLMDQASLKPDQLDVVGFVRGPGSFTGLRIGTAVAYGLQAAISGLRLVGHSSLFLLQKAGLREDCPRVLSIVDARKQQIYAGLFEKGKPVCPYALLGPDDLSDFVEASGIDPAGLAIVGSAITRYPEKVTVAFPRARILETPLSLAPLLAEELMIPTGGEDPCDEPLYIRRSDAEITRDAKIDNAD